MTQTHTGYLCIPLALSRRVEVGSDDRDRSTGQRLGHPEAVQSVLAMSDRHEPRVVIIDRYLRKIIFIICSITYD